MRIWSAARSTTGRTRFRSHGLARRLTFAAIALAPGLRAPSLIADSEGTASPDGPRCFQAALVADKAIARRSGTGVDFNDQPAPVADAADRAVAQFARYLR